MRYVRESHNWRRVASTEVCLSHRARATCARLNTSQTWLCSARFLPGKSCGLVTSRRWRRQRLPACCSTAERDTGAGFSSSVCLLCVTVILRGLDFWGRGTAVRWGKEEDQKPRRGRGGGGLAAAYINRSLQTLKRVPVWSGFDWFKTTIVGRTPMSSMLDIFIKIDDSPHNHTHSYTSDTSKTFFLSKHVFF